MVSKRSYNIPWQRGRCSLMNRVHTATSAAILTHGTSICRHTLRWGVVHVVTRCLTTALKYVIQSQPVAHLVRRCLAQFVPRLTSSRYRAILEYDSVILQIVLDVPREGCVAQKTVVEINAVEVEGLLVALAKCRFHFGLQVGVRRNIIVPLCVVDAVCDVEIKREAVSLVVVVQDLDLVLNHCIGQVSCATRVDDMPHDLHCFRLLSEELCIGQRARISGFALGAGTALLTDRSESFAFCLDEVLRNVVNRAV